MYAPAQHLPYNGILPASNSSQLRNVVRLARLSGSLCNPPRISLPQNCPVSSWTNTGFYHPRGPVASSQLKCVPCESHLPWAAADYACFKGHLHLRFQVTAPPYQPQMGWVLPVTPGQKTHPKRAPGITLTAQYLL